MSIKKKTRIDLQKMKASRTPAVWIRDGAFPKEEHAYKMIDGELDKLKKLIDG